MDSPETFTGKLWLAIRASQRAVCAVAEEQVSAESRESMELWAEAQRRWSAVYPLDAPELRFGKAESADASPALAAAPAGAFMPTDVQRTILAELKGQARSKPQLNQTTHIPLSTLGDNLRILKKEGKVSYRRGLGFYRPDALPPDE